MDSSTLFAQLPVEVLVEVFSRLKTIDVARVWICGNRALNYLMSERGAVREVLFGAEKTITFAWPLLVTNFHYLHVFQLTTREESLCKPLSFEQLDLLPRRLKTLELIFPTQNGALYHFLKATSSEFSNLTTLKLSVMQEYPDSETYEEQIWGPNLPPSLTALTIVFQPPPGEDGALLRFTVNEPRYHRRRLDLEHLPPNLVELLVQNNFYPPTPSENHRLPPTLTKFTTCALSSKHCFSSSWIPTLPENLQTFGLLEPSPKSSLLPIFQQLPRGLERLLLHYSIDSLNREHVKALPPALTSISTFAEFSPELLVLLPPGIRELPLSYKTQFNAETAQFIPRHMTSLTSPCELAALPMVPPSVRSLRLFCGSGSPFSGSVPALDIFNNLNSAVSAPTKKEWPTLPPNLTSLQVDVLIAPIAEQLKQLPLLRTLHISASHLAYSSISSHLPRTLTELTLDALDVSSERALTFLPPSLTKLYASVGFNVSITLTIDSALTLPRRLKHLSLKRFTIEPSWFSALPSSLRRIDLRGSFNQAQAQELAHSCPDLEHFEIGLTTAADESTSWLRFMPANTSFLSISNVQHGTPPQLNPQDLDALPSHLKALIVHSFTLSPETAFSLPPSLTSLFVDSKRPVWFRPSLCRLQHRPSSTSTAANEPIKVTQH